MFVRGYFEKAWLNNISKLWRIYEEERGGVLLIISLHKFWKCKNHITKLKNAPLLA